MQVENRPVIHDYMRGFYIKTWLVQCSAIFALIISFCSVHLFYSVQLSRFDSFFAFSAHFIFFRPCTCASTQQRNENDKETNGMDGKPDSGFEFLLLFFVYVNSHTNKLPAHKSHSNYNKHEK